MGGAGTWVYTAIALCFPRFHDCPVETESPEKAGASWVGQQGPGRVAGLHLPAVPDAARCQGGAGGQGAIGSGRRRGVFAALLGFFEMELSMGAGISPRSRNSAVESPRVPSASGFKRASLSDPTHPCPGWWVK